MTGEGGRSGGWAGGAGGPGDAGARHPGGPGVAGRPEDLDDVLASIRALVTAETTARSGEGPGAVLMLTPEMRIDEAEDAPRVGEVLTDGLTAGLRLRAEPAPILDEEAIRAVVNRIVREELQGELGDRISRNLRKLIRREIGQLRLERDEDPPGA